ncbi:Macrophage colony-stimulating factor 1 receptor [Lithohypha guttulata]|uniref:Macrophage colony-stimulating factor 1 receptor n=1 Tax=Lithohypha guttulata TaxID=1690604 RepID=A0AAN7YBA5_9EURO|nr:Macrophage colony-stimulating factor 1 receptor [Lithohypha guttulata]
MAGLNGLTSESLGSNPTFNWTWFIELLTSAILVLWFLFYLNRLFASAISYGLRAYSWHKFRVYLDIQSLQISLLGGRIFFKGVRYHGENESVYIHNGHLTWRYWLRVTKQIALCKSAIKNREQDEKAYKNSSETGSETSLPEYNRNEPESRIVVSITGLEWFIYNRTPVYDAIIQDVDVRASSSTSVGGQSTANALSQTVAAKLRQHAKVVLEKDASILEEKLDAKEDFQEPSSKDSRSTSPRDSDEHSINSEAAPAETDVSSFYSFILRFFPVGIECARGAVSLGNEHTKAIIVTTFDRAKGHIDAGASGPADLYRQIFDFDIEHPVVQMKPNPDFHLPHMAAAERVIAGHEAVLKRRPWWRPTLNLNKKRKTWSRGLRNLIPHFRRSVSSLHDAYVPKEDEQTYAAFTDARPDSQDWQGLDRYMDEDEGDDHHAWLSVEYARFSTILDCPHVHINFYWDTPGEVHPEHLTAPTSGLAAELNGLPPPEYGMHLEVYGGLVNYGPWSDRLRIELQNVFLPAGYNTAQPKDDLLAGDPRLSTVMNITVDIKKEMTLRVPTREDSKDWRWRGRATAVRDAAALRRQQQQRRHFRFRRSTKRRLGPDIRSFGWIAIAAGAHSKVRYTMDIFPGFDGYRNGLQLNLRNTKATSSVNHATLWECKNQDVSADLSNPLGWNQLHTWRFDITNKNMDLFLLRDHTFLLLDLISDFTAGQKSDYMTFVPFKYVIGIKFLDLNLFLNANDQNIIDNPCDFEENTFLVLGFARLVGQVDIPMQYYSPAQGTVKFKGDGQDASLTLKTPVWHTLHNFGHNENMATLKTLHLDGSYNYYSTTSPKLTDSLFMSIHGGNPRFNLQGYLIRFFMNVKENYFGDTIHFSTLEEHQSRLDRHKRGEEERKAPVKKQNDLDVILSVRTDRAVAVMPASIYHGNEDLRVDVLQIDADMRFTNYYMDLQVNTSPVEVSIEKSMWSEGKFKRDATGCQLFIDGISVYGHRLFGAPPAEPTYLCNWDFDVGEIGGECTTDFIRILLTSIMSFVFTMDDDENALPQAEVVLIPDITFLRMRAAGLRTWIVSSDTAFLLSISGTTVELNDWANQHFSKYVKVDSPMILLAAVDSATAYRHRESPEKAVPTHACIRSSLKLAVLDRKPGFSHNRALQQQHVRMHDSRTRRAEFLLHKHHQLEHDQFSTSWSRQPPAMPLPTMPQPVTLLGTAVSAQGQSPKSQSSSFLALNPLDNRLNQISRDTNSYMDDFRHHQLRPHTAFLTPSLKHSVSSPWIRPHFPLQDVQPDQEHLPHLDTSACSDDDGFQEDLQTEEFPTTQEDFGHDGIFCNLVDGIVGVFTPSLIQSVVTLLNEISPQHPESILDDLQIQVISNIKKLTATHVGKVDDMSFRLPASHLRLINPHEATDTDISFDQYDFRLDDTRVTVRLAPSTHAKDLQPRISIYASLRKLNVKVSEIRPHIDQFASEAEVVLAGLGLWLSLKEEVRARTHINNLEFITAGENVDKLAELIRRSEALVEKAVEQMSQIDLGERTQHLLYHLTSIQTYQDPSFMIRAVNVLRTAEDHIRLHDSWKMVIRLRLLLASQISRGDQSYGCSSSCLNEDRVQVRKHILASFDKWKTWENAGQDDNALVQAVFGPSRQVSGQSQYPINVEVEVLLGRAALTLDPGPDQSQLFIQSLDLNFSEKLSQETKKSWSFGSQHRSSRIVQAYCGTMGCHLNWELIKLAERIVELSQSYQTKETITGSEGSAEQGVRDDVIDLSVVIGADAASIDIQTINLRLVTGVERFRASVSLGFEDMKKMNTSVVLSAASGRFRLRSKSKSKSKSILGCKVSAPTIHLSTQIDKSSSGGTIVLHSAATCRKLRLHVKEDILGLLQLVEIIFKAEIVEVKRLMKTLADKSAPTQQDVKPGNDRNARKVQPHVALFLDDYLMQFDLMAYLKYSIAGKVARTSVVPYNAKRFSVNLDVKENYHSFQNPTTDTKVSKSVLKMPPLSATIAVAIRPDRIGVDARVAIDRMLLEASAVRACFDAAYRNQTIEYVNRIKASVASIKESVNGGVAKHESTISAPEAGLTTSRERTVQYHGYLVFEGIGVRCRAPALRPDQDYLVDLNMRLDSTSLRIGNLREADGMLYQKPHFEVNLRQFSTSIDRVGKATENFGHIHTGVRISGLTEIGEDGVEVQNFHLTSNGINVDLFAETALLSVDLMTFLQARIKTLAAAEDAKKLKPLRRLTLAAPTMQERSQEPENAIKEEEASGLLSSTFVVELNAICLQWLISSNSKQSPIRPAENMALTVTKIDLRTQREASARLSIRNLQLQLVPNGSDPFDRTANSALLPEMVFNAAYARANTTRKFAFKAAGKLLDVKLASNFILPAAAIQESLALASSELRSLKTFAGKDEASSSQTQLPKLLGNKRLAHLLVFADFVGAEVTISPAREASHEQESAFGFLKGSKRSRAGRYGQAVQSSTGEDATLRAPGVAFQVEYSDDGAQDPMLSTEVRVAASSNTLAPSVVPLVLEISRSIKNLMGQDNSQSAKKDTQDAESPKDKSIGPNQQAADPTAVLGKVKLNAELLVQRQEFSLTCQPIARVSATAQFEEIFVVVNTVQAKDQERFFSLMTTFNDLEASVQHVYSRESTASFTVKSIAVSLMNSKHFSNKSGISAILNVSPMKAYLNAKQMQDFLLFREIWYPTELRASNRESKPVVREDTLQGPAIQRFQEVTTTAVLPWHAIVSIQEVNLQVDFGQSIGKSDFAIEKLWASSKKTSDAEQNLCVGFDKIGIDSHGRMSGFVELQRVRVRTAIRWPMVEEKLQAPLVQGSVGFEHLRAKAVFDYQPFAVADISSFEFLIYNVRQGRASDRLVGILDGGKVQVFCTTAAAAQGLSIVQAFERLVQEKQEAFEANIHELDRYLRRKSVMPSSTWKSPSELEVASKQDVQRPGHAPRLHVDVVITLRAIDAGVFTSSFFDETTLKLEAVDVQARFAVNEIDDKTHSGLGMSLGQVRLALSTMSRPNAKALGEVSVTEVIDRATSARGGTILKVPRLVASMQTWQQARSNVIEYVFSSTFQGKVDIGWNYSRISTIRRMWDSHSRTLAQKMSKPLAPSAIKITAEPKSEAEGQEKITAVVHMPQSKYEYIALEPPIIDTPQLRDLGEATPSLEWIGLNRERLPHVTHSVIIVSLLEVAKEIEDSYSRILGSG